MWRVNPVHLLWLPLNSVHAIEKDEICWHQPPRVEYDNRLLAMNSRRADGNLIWCISEDFVSTSYNYVDGHSGMDTPLNLVVSWSLSGLRSRITILHWFGNIIIIMRIILYGEFILNCKMNKCGRWTWGINLLGFICMVISIIRGVYFSCSVVECLRLNMFDCQSSLCHINISVCAFQKHD